MVTSINDRCILFTKMWQFESPIRIWKERRLSRTIIENGILIFFHSVDFGFMCWVQASLQTSKFKSWLLQNQTLQSEHCWLLCYGKFLRVRLPISRSWHTLEQRMATKTFIDMGKKCHYWVLSVLPPFQCDPSLLSEILVFVHSKAERGDKLSMISFLSSTAKRVQWWCCKLQPERN